MNLKETEFFYPRANGAKRRSARKPGRGLLIPLGYLHPGECQHSEGQSHPPCHGRWTLDGFRRYAHARVITD